MSADYRFSFGPWNIHEGADPFGPAVRPSVPTAEKWAAYGKLGFSGVQLHDDDAVPDLESKTAAQAQAEARQLRQTLADHGLAAEMLAPRLWEDPRGIDGGFTANDPKVRQWAIDRSRRTADLARELGTDLMVLWLAREGTYLRESKDPLQAYAWLIEGMNAVLAHDPGIRIAIEPKPNEPVDHAFISTMGHALAIAHQTIDPARVGGVVETAHAQLAGLDPSEEMAFALQAGKLWSVHLNDQNGLKFDQDKTFGAANLRAAYNQVRVLERAGYAATGGYIGLDVKAMRTTLPEHGTRHLSNSREIFLWLVEKVRSFDADLERQCVANRDYEALELAVIRHLLGVGA